MEYIMVFLILGLVVQLSIMNWILAQISDSLKRFNGEPL